jgi:ferredoxin-NADP reductase
LIWLLSPKESEKMVWIAGGIGVTPFRSMAKFLTDKNENRDSYLFLHNDVYLHNIYYEYTIFASYNDIKNIDKEIIITFNNSQNRLELDNILCNMKFYNRTSELAELQRIQKLSFETLCLSLEDM